MSSPVPAEPTDRREAAEPAPAAQYPWLRLHSRMIWVDVVVSLLSLSPAALAVWVFGVPPTSGNLWPVLAVAVFGVLGAGADALRWVLTRYRVTPDYVERRTGIVVRRYRSVRRDRVRSVDTDAKLRHRLAGLRVVQIGAGQQASANESALALDAVSKQDAELLRHELLATPGRRDDERRSTERSDSVTNAETTTETTAGSTAGSTAAVQDTHVFARLRSWWVVYNMFNIWAYLMAAGILWGLYWLGTTFGLDLSGYVAGLLDWQALGWGWTIAIAAVAVGAVGVAGLGVNFFTEYWAFELSRVPGQNGTLLRTRRGLFRTREVNRDDRRMRGIQIGEPLLWRWMGMADTNVITTGLDLWSSSQPTTILPRGPISVARSVSAAVLDTTPNPLETPLPRHPRAAMRRRIWWATLFAGGVAGLLAWLAATGVVPSWSVWIGVGSWPVALGAAVVAYRALGHAIVGDYLVTRSGLSSRTTSVLLRKAVSTIAIRESLLQRRLGLKTVSAMTAAGWGIYEAPDVAAEHATAFADNAAPGLLTPFLEHRTVASSTDLPSALNESPR